MSTAEGKDRRDEGLERVERNADAAEWDRVWAFALQVAGDNEFFTSDDIAEAAGGIAFRENRAMGALVQRMKKLKLATPTPDFATCTRANQHACPKRIWQSLIWRNGAVPAPTDGNQPNRAGQDRAQGVLPFSQGKVK